MEISEIYDYLKLNGVKQLETGESRIYVEHILIVNLEHAWLNVDFADDCFSTKPLDTKPTKKLTIFDLDRFISEYKYYYSDDRIRDIKLDKMRSAITKHRMKSSITVNGTEVLQND